MKELFQDQGLAILFFNSSLFLFVLLINTFFKKRNIEKVNEKMMHDNKIMLSELTLANDTIEDLEYNILELKLDYEAYKKTMGKV